MSWFHPGKDFCQRAVLGGGKVLNCEAGSHHNKWSTEYCSVAGRIDLCRVFFSFELDFQSEKITRNT